MPPCEGTLRLKDKAAERGQCGSLARSCIHARLGTRYATKVAVEMPTAFDINTSIQRCLVKAIALHGLGLYIYAGEDLPEGADQQRPVPAADFVNAEQIARIKSLLAETGQTLQRLLSFLHVEAVEQIPASEYPRVEQLLERSKRKAA